MGLRKQFGISQFITFSICLGWEVDVWRWEVSVQESVLFYHKGPGARARPAVWWWYLSSLSHRVPFLATVCEGGMCHGTDEDVRTTSGLSSFLYGFQVSNSGLEAWVAGALLTQPSELLALIPSERPPFIRACHWQPAQTNHIRTIAILEYPLGAWSECHFIEIMCNWIIVIILLLNLESQIWGHSGTFTWLRVFTLFGFFFFKCHNILLKTGHFR